MRRLIVLLLIFIFPSTTLFADHSSPTASSQNYEESCIATSSEVAYNYGYGYDGYGYEYDSYYPNGYCEYCGTSPCSGCNYCQPYDIYDEEYYPYCDSYPPYDPCSEPECASCDPCCTPYTQCASICGTECGVSVAAIGLAVVALAAVAVLIVTVSERSSNEHSAIL